MSLDAKLKQGPRENITYPLLVVYCGNCTMPIEVRIVIFLFHLELNTYLLYFQYCEYYPEYEKCKQWLEKNLPTEFEKVKIGDDNNPVEEEKKRQKRGGKGMIKTKKKEDGPKQVYVSRAPRGKKKSVTVVTGLVSFGKLTFLISNRNASNSYSFI